MNAITLGDVIRADREDKELTQEGLGKLLNVSQQAVARWETNLSIPQGENRKKLVDLFGPNSRLAKFRMPAEFVPGAAEAAAERRAQRSARSPEASRWVMFDWPLEREAVYQHGELQRQLLAELPEQFRANVARVRTFGHVERPYDYVSDAVVAQVVALEPAPKAAVERLALPTLRLAVAVDAPRLHEMPPTVALFVLTEENSFMLRKRLESLVMDAGILNVTLEVVHAMGEVASAIVALEAMHEQRRQDYAKWQRQLTEVKEPPDTPAK